MVLIYFIFKNIKLFILNKILIYNILLIIKYIKVNIYLLFKNNTI